MAQSTTGQLIFIEMRRWWQRALLLVPMALLVVSAYYAVRWWYGNMLTETVNTPEGARHAVELAPDDPRARYVLAELSKGDLPPDEQYESFRQRERALSLSPHDYLLWMDAGSAREQAGYLAAAEKAFRRATELAPAYAQPHWLLGNLLLRQGRMEEALTELQRAGDADPQLRPTIFNIAMGLYNDDVHRGAAALGNSPAVRASFIEYLLHRGRLDEAVELWASLDANARWEQQRVSEALQKALFEKRRFRQFLEVHVDIAANSATGRAAVGQLLNGGFESEVQAPGASLLGWQITSVPQAQIVIDARERKTGARSLRIAFAAPMNVQFSNVSQLVVVQPGARYRLEYFSRTENLKSANTLVAEVVDATNPANPVLSRSAPLPNGTSDWQQVTLDFTVPAQTDGIIVRLSRTPCALATCPIFGKVWYDDFNLQQFRAADSRARGK